MKGVICDLKTDKNTPIKGRVSHRRESKEREENRKEITQFFQIPFIIARFMFINTPYANGTSVCCFLSFFNVEL